MSIPSLSTPTSSSSSSTFGSTSDASTANDKFQTELDIIQSWFSLLNEAERTQAFTIIAETTYVREIEPLIQTLKDRKRGLWRQQEKLSVHHDDREKNAMPPFPHGSSDPKWLIKWLRALRLHKYEKNLAHLSTGEVAALTDEHLQRLGVDTLGARKKLLRAIQLK